jgi:hypothetical protein
MLEAEVSRFVAVLMGGQPAVLADRRDLRRRERKQLRIGHPQREAPVADDGKIQLDPPIGRQTPVDVLQPVGSGHQGGDGRPLSFEPRRIADEPHQAKPPGLSGATGRFGNVKAPDAAVAGLRSLSEVKMVH